MAQFQIDGADRETGRSKRITITAASEDEAREAARRRGLMISDIIGPPTPAEPTAPPRPSPARLPRELAGSHLGLTISSSAVVAIGLYLILSGVRLFSGYGAGGLGIFLSAYSGLALAAGGAICCLFGFAGLALRDLVRANITPPHQQGA